MPKRLSTSHYPSFPPETARVLRQSLDETTEMFTRLYIEALLVDRETADEIWRAWKSGALSDVEAAWASAHVARENNANGKC